MSYKEIMPHNLVYHDLKRGGAGKKQLELYAEMEYLYDMGIATLGEIAELEQIIQKQIKRGDIR